MNVNYDGFIGIYNNVFPEGYCEHLVEQMDIMEREGVGSNRILSESASRHIKSDYQIGLINDNNTVPFVNRQNERLSTRKIFFDGLQDCFSDYQEKFSIIKHNPLNTNYIKLQKTTPGEGYHVWHYEQGGGESASRALVWLMYLNTLEPEEAGETEFLYQQKRFRPVKNTMIFWPAAFTHTHRGNTVYGKNNKYVATGWFHLQ
jgi:hypothetical protein